MLTIDEIRLLLDLLAEDTVVEPSETFPFRISRRRFGYSDDPVRGRLQGKLSIMGEVATKLGKAGKLNRG